MDFFMNANHHEGHTGATRQQFQSLDENMQRRAALEAMRKSQLEDHLAMLSTNYQNWFSRLGLSREDRALLKAYSERQLEAAKIILTEQNKILTVISRAQVLIVEEIVYTLQKTTRVGLKSIAIRLYSEAILNLQTDLERASVEVYDLVEKKYKQAEERPMPVRIRIIAEIDTLLTNWALYSRRLQEDFISILTQ